MRVQVHNLQSLQDALSEEKQKNKTLLEQKRALRQQLTLAEEARETELTSHEQTTHDLKQELALVTKEAQDLATQLTANNLLIHSFQAQAQAQAESAALPVPSADRLMVEKLTESVNHLEQEVLELTAHNTSLEGSLTQKTRKIEELSHEIDSLRSAATTGSDELNRIRSEALRTEASLEAELLEKERSYEELTQRYSDSEQSAERTNKQLKEYLLILNEKDRTNEELIDQLQEQVATLSAQLDKAKEARLSADAKNFLLSKQLSDSEERIGQLESREEVELRESSQEFRTLSSKVHLPPSSSSLLTSFLLSIVAGAGHTPPRGRRGQS
jgi:chromosome segregation ATPase